MTHNSESHKCPEIQASELASSGGDLILVDVRSPIEFETEHIDGSINIPLESIDSRSNEVPRKGRLVVICRSGKRAERASYSLAGKGYQPSILAGGLLAWRQSGLPLKEGKKMLSIERQIQLVVGVSVLVGVSLAVLVSPWFLVIPAFFGAGLTFAGLSGTCALGILLGKCPWNQLRFSTSEKATGDASCHSK